MDRKRSFTQCHLLQPFPGEYTLFVKYRNNINGKESHPQAFTIYIAPPPVSQYPVISYVGYFLLGVTIMYRA